MKNTRHQLPVWSGVGDGKLWGCCSFAWYCSKGGSNAYLMETACCLWKPLPTSSWLVSDAELTLLEFSPDIYCKEPQCLSPGSRRSAGVFPWSLALVPRSDSARDFLISLSRISGSHPQELCQATTRGRHAPSETVSVHVWELATLRPRFSERQTAS